MPLAVVASPPSQERRRRVAFLVGVSTYEHPDIRPLRFVESDVRALENVLTTVDYQTITVLTDHNATADAVFRAAQQLKQDLTSNDILFFYYSGHGFRDERDSYLLAHDSIPPTRSQEPAQRIISLTALFEALPRTYATVFVTDACHQDSPFHQGFVFPPLLPENVAGFASSSPEEVSHEVPELSHGLFTNYLLEGLRGRADREGKGVVTVFDLHRYVARKVQDYAKTRRLRQTPVLTYRGTEDIPVVAQYPPSQEELDAHKRAEEADQLYKDMLTLFGAEEWIKVLDTWDRLLRLAPGANDFAKGFATALEARKQLDADTQLPTDPGALETYPRVWFGYTERHPVFPGAMITHPNASRGDLILEVKREAQIRAIVSAARAATSAFPGPAGNGTIRYHALTDRKISFEPRVSLEKIEAQASWSDELNAAWRKLLEAWDKVETWNTDIRNLDRSRERQIWARLRANILRRHNSAVQEFWDLELTPLQAGMKAARDPGPLRAAAIQLCETYEELAENMVKKLIRNVIDELKQESTTAVPPAPEPRSNGTPAPPVPVPLAPVEGTSPPAPGGPTPVSPPAPEANSPNAAEPTAAATRRPTAPGPESPIVVSRVTSTARDHLVISVTATTVTLTYKGHVYTGPSLLKDAGSELLAASASAQEYGELLFQKLIHDELGPVKLADRTTRQGYQTARRENEGALRVELRMDLNDPALHSYRWETLKDPNGSPLALDLQGSVFRYIPGPRDGRPCRAVPIKVLAVLCDPRRAAAAIGDNAHLKSLPPVDFGAQRDALEAGLARLGTTGLVQYKVLDFREAKGDVNLDRLVETLRDRYHVLHLVAHGIFIGRTYHVVMEGTKAAEVLVPAGRLQQELSTAGLRLVVLCACWSGVAQDGGLLSGLGTQVVSNRVPAVIAMQDELPDDAAALFNRYFYQELARTGCVARATVGARDAIYQKEGAKRAESWVWSTPVLLMSGDDGRIFEVKEDAGEKLDALAAVIPPPPKAGTKAPGPPVTVHSASAHPGPAAEWAARGQDRQALTSGLATAFRIDPNELQGEIEQRSGLRLRPAIYGQIAAALNMGKHLLLLGEPGTGKTCLAQALGAFAMEHKLATGIAFATATADWSTFDTVGGYHPAPGQSLQFRAGLFLGALSTGRWLIVDEVNRADIDKALGELFTVLSGQRVDLPYAVGGEPVCIVPGAGTGGWVPADVRSRYEYVVHPHWRVIATMNAYDKSYLYGLSFALVRRFAVVHLGIPSRDDYRALVNRWTDEARPLLGSSDADLSPLRGTLDQLLRPEAALRRSRPLGPAITRDMIRHVADRHGSGEAVKELLAEAFLLHAAHQFDGLDRQAVLDVRGHLKDVFEGTVAWAAIDERLQLLYPYLADERDGSDV